MIEFFILPRAIVFIVTISLTLCVIAQTIAAVMSFFRYPRSRARISETALELLILGHIMLCTLLHMQAEEEFVSGVLVPPEYVAVRLIIFAAIITAVVLVTLYTKKPNTVPVVLAAGLTLPFIENLTGYSFVYLNLTFIIFCLIRSIILSIWYNKETKDSLSASSVKNMIDSMITGVMFCQQNGFILLVNERMQQLMLTITGKTQRNGRHFFGMLTLGEIEPGCSAKWFEDKNVIILPDGSAWQFTITELTIGKKKYIQLTATEISEQWKLTTELNPQNDMLLKRQGELNTTISNLHILSQERETQKAKMRAHDVLGEHLTVLQSIIFGNKTPDYALLRSLSQGLLDDLNSVSNQPTPQDELESLRQIFLAIGVDLEVSGNMPADPEKGRLFADIIREAVNNSVRHGFANKVIVHMDESAVSSKMEISDNGYAPLSIREGGGISGMRKKIEPFNGSMQVTIAPQFILTIDLPGGEDSDQSTDS